MSATRGRKAEKRNGFTGDRSLANSKSQSADEESNEVATGSVAHEKNRPAENVEGLESSSGAKRNQLRPRRDFPETNAPLLEPRMIQEATHHPLSDRELLKSQVLRPFEDQVGEICEMRQISARFSNRLRKKRTRTHRRSYRASCTEESRGSYLS